MASALTSGTVAGTQLQASQLGRACCPARLPRAQPRGLGNALKVRAAEEETAVAPSGERKGPAKDAVFCTDSTALTYLDGTLPGDYGFDPFGLCDPRNNVGFINPSWLRYAEIIHGRFAMLGAAGCIAPEILAYVGVIPQETGVVFFRNGVIPPAGIYDGYWADPYTLFFIEAIAMNFAELRRLQDYRKPGSMGKQYFIGLERIFEGSGDPAYPGGPFFNMFNLGKTEESLRDLKTKELNNGRLAMMAMFGFGAQAVMTGQGPFQCWLDHISDPFGNNILTNWGNVLG
eukprot:evm.model.scf_1854.5 EVM.evm.TU.scf_1854.5   scf_1854:13061-16437(+)